MNALLGPQLSAPAGSADATTLAGVTPTTVGLSVVGLTNPSAITFLRMNADNSVTALSAANFRTALGIGTTDAITFGALTVTSVNGNFFTAGSSTYTGTAGQTYTFPTTSATIARTDAANTFTGTQTITTLAGTSSITGAASNMTIVSGTGNSRTMIFQTTTSGGTATTALTLGADQTATFAGAATFPSGSSSAPSVVASGSSNSGFAFNLGGSGRIAFVSAGTVYAYADGSSNLGMSSGIKLNWSSGTPEANAYDTGFARNAVGIVEVNNGTPGTFRDMKLRALTMSVAGLLSISAGTNQRAGNATLVGGTVTVSNTTVTANTVVILTRKTSGGTIGTAITYTLSAGASFTVNSDNILDTSTFSYLLIEVP